MLKKSGIQGLAGLAQPRRAFVADGVLDSIKPLVILAGPSCGADSLGRALGQEARCCFIGEPFDPVRVNDPLNFWRYLEFSGRIAEWVDLERRKEKVGQWLDFLTQSNTGRQPVLIVNYNKPINLSLGIFGAAQCPAVIEALLAADCRFILLSRRNRLQQHVARLLEVENNDPGGTLARQEYAGVSEVEIDTDHLADEIAKIDSGVLRAKSWIASTPSAVHLLGENLEVNGRLSEQVIDVIGTLVGRKLAFLPKMERLPKPGTLAKMMVNPAELAGLCGEAEADGVFEDALQEIDSREFLLSRANEYFSFKIVCNQPLLTFSSTDPRAISLARLAKSQPDFFDVPKAIHLIHYQWSLESSDPMEMAGRLRAAQILMPNHLLVSLVSNEAEVEIVTKAGFSAILANGSIFADEFVWNVFPPDFSQVRHFDAAYVARLDALKRHELASRVQNLMLVYDHAESGTPDDWLQRTRAKLPNAYFANHELNNGHYQKFDMSRVARLLAHASVGLCLSAVEGFMRASFEYLLCGLPVVSTGSVGGRDRYYIGSHCMVVTDDPVEVAAAVRQLAEMNFNRQDIRNHTLSMLTFDRFQFMQNLERIGKAYFGKGFEVPEFAQFRGAINIRHVSENLAKMDNSGKVLR